MYGVWNPEQVSAAEEPVLARTPEGALMRRAASGVAHRAAAMLAERTGGVTGRRVVVLTGAGNNGGDGLWAGYELRRRGAQVTAVLLAPTRAHPAGLAALRRARGRVVTVIEAGVAAVTEADLVVDAIVGTGARGGLRPEAATLVDAVRTAGAPVLAVDTPSGVDPRTGVPGEDHVRAAATVTFGARKPVHVLAAGLCGPVDLVDLGLGPELPEPPIRVLSGADVGARWPVPGPGDDKYTQGVVGVAAGSATYPGAAVLASGAAALATSGMVRYAGSAAHEVRAAWPEIVATDTVGEAGRVQAWAVGPGLGTDDAGARTLAAVLDAGLPVLADADAVTLLGEHADLRARAAGAPVLITPHAGEFARVAELSDDRVDSARRAAADLGVTVLLKGNATVVAAPDGRVLVHPAGSSWLATAGSGDVLTGVAGALLAAGLEPWWAAGLAAHVHARAADLGARGEEAVASSPVPASRVQAALPRAIREARAAAGGTVVTGAPATPAPGAAVRPPPPRAEALVDLDAVAHNVATLAARTAPGAGLMAVVKADGYGHGAVGVGRAALAAGATWLGVCSLEEAAQLRGAGLRAPVLTWLVPVEEDRAGAIADDVDLTVASVAELDAVVAGARRAGRRARVHLKIDTGLSRNGCPPDEWGGLLRAVAAHGDDVEPWAIWSHLAHADEPAHPTLDRQAARLDDAWRAATTHLGVPLRRHLANSGATLTRPDLHFDLVRPGIAVYGLDPVDAGSGADLRPAMTFRSRVVLCKRVAAGEGVSYGHEWTAPGDRMLALVPVGYADGVPRGLGGSMSVQVAGVRRPVVGRVCMDQVVVDAGPAGGDGVPEVGDEVLLFGPGDHGEPTAADWARDLGTIHYEIVTGVGHRPRVTRTPVGDPGAGR